MLCDACGELSSPVMSSWGDVCPKCGDDMIKEVEVSDCPDEKDCHSAFHNPRHNKHIFPVT